MTSASGESPKRSLFKLLAEVPGLIVDLFRQEIENLKAELVAKVKHAGVGVGLLAGAGVVALFLLGTLIAAGILGLATVLPAWAAALIVAGVLLMIVLVLVLIGLRQLKASGKPLESIDSMKTDVQVIRGTAPASATQPSASTTKGQSS
jgi:ABC-type transport system involved in multi-copper enzyme maturation permease subunit